LTKGCDAYFFVQEEEHLALFEYEDGVNEVNNTIDMQQRYPHGFPPEYDYGKDDNIDILASHEGVLTADFENIMTQGFVDARKVIFLKWDEK